jgi:DnaJ-class molecular chaperone
LNTSIDYYSLLGVKPAASADEIKRAYRRMVFRFHPDRNPGDDDAAGKFKEVIDAYAVLSDGLKRSTYDAIRHPAKAQEEPEEERAEEAQQPFGDKEAGNGFRSNQEFTGQEFKGRQAKGAVEAEPKCPSCAVVGGEHVVSRRGGGAKSRGKQFVLAPFNIVFCDACGHVYGVTASAG